MTAVVERPDQTTHLIMRPTDHTTPFDHELDTSADLTDEFWGPSPGWDPVARAVDRGPDTTTATRRPDHTTGTMRAIREGVAAFRPRRVELRDPTGQMRRTRVHGGHPVEPSMTQRRASASIGDLAAGHFDDFDELRQEAGQAGDVPLSPAGGEPRVGLGAVDPLLARLGALILVGVLLVPVALALRPAATDPDTVRIETPAEVQVGGLAAPAGAAPAQPGGSQTAPGATAADSSSGESTAATSAEAATGQAAAVATAPPSDDPQVDAADAAGVAQGEAETKSLGETTQVASASDRAGIASAATVDAVAERVVPECPQTYTAGPGDSWYRIADAAGVTPDALLTENRATVDTVILVGDDICLPSGATMPSPPTTDPATTQPEPTTPPVTDPPVTDPPVTDPPAPPAGSPGRDASVDEVKDVIRDIFPESEWETAFTIADRESGFVPTAYNGWCCYGVFQIYWTVHRGWLDDLGIDRADDLYDPLLNVQAAHAIFQRSGNSWRAWSTYDG